MNNKPDFNQVINQDWTLWGMHFHFLFPGPDEEIRSMQASINQAPGEEPWEFYEQAKDLQSGVQYSTGQFAIMDMEQLTAEQIAQRLPHHPLHFSRRRFNHAWFVEYAGRSESFWFDIWIHRHDADKDLFDPAELQSTHLNFLVDKLYDPAAKDEDDLLLFDDLAPEWNALNWRWTNIGGYAWQTYDEIKMLYADDSYKFGYNFLLPLSQRHYLRFRFYRLNASNYREASDDFEKLVQSILENFSCELSPEADEKLPQPNTSIALARVDVSKQLSADSFKIWKKMDHALRSDSYTSCTIEETPAIAEAIADSANNNRFAIIIGIVAIILFACLGKGYFFIQDWLEQHPDSRWHWVQNFYFIVFLLWCLRDRLKKWAEPSP